VEGIALSGNSAGLVLPIKPTPSQWLTNKRQAKDKS
jgi:hypothetical protein